MNFSIAITSLLLIMNFSVAIILLLLFSYRSNFSLTRTINVQGRIHSLHREANSTALVECPVKIYVYDLGSSSGIRNPPNETSGWWKRGFNADAARRGSYTYITSPLSSDNDDYQWFIFQKFLLHSRCAARAPNDADFFVLPTFSYPPWNAPVGLGMNEALEALEEDFNRTLFRRGQKDHILLNALNPRRGWNKYRSKVVTNRTRELITPMVKVLADVWVWQYNFGNRHHTGTAPEVAYDRLLAVPYAASIREFKGNIHKERPYLASFSGNDKYPPYRKAIAEQCRVAIDCSLGATDRSSAYQANYDIYVNSTFFFSPGGDTGTRKGLFDGIALNSIPVIFEETSIDVTYPAYFPGNPRDYSVFITLSDDVMGPLRAIPSSRIAELRRNIARIRDSVSYMPDPDSFDATWKMMEQLKQYKDNAYSFRDPFPNKTTLNCVDRFREKCRFQ